MLRIRAGAASAPLRMLNVLKGKSQDGIKIGSSRNLVGYPPHQSPSVTGVVALTYFYMHYRLYFSTVYATPSVSTVARLMRCSCTGRSWKPVGVLAMRSTTSMPSSTMPKAA